MANKLYRNKSKTNKITSLIETTKNKAKTELKRRVSDSSIQQQLVIHDYVIRKENGAFNIYQHGVMIYAGIHSSDVVYALISLHTTKQEKRIPLILSLNDMHGKYLEEMSFYIAKRNFKNLSLDDYEILTHRIDECVLNIDRLMDEIDFICTLRFDGKTIIFR